MFFLLLFLLFDGLLPQGGGDNTTTHREDSGGGRKCGADNGRNRRPVHEAIYRHKGDGCASVLEEGSEAYCEGDRR